MALSLKSPITIQIPAIHKKNGEIKQFPPVVMSEIDYSVSYDNSRKFAVAMIKTINRPVILWAKDEYDAIGQFTDADVDARLKKILGKNPEAFIESLLEKNQSK